MACQGLIRPLAVSNKVQGPQLTQLLLAQMAKGSVVRNPPQNADKLTPASRRVGLMMSHTGKNNPKIESRDPQNLLWDAFLSPAAIAPDPAN